MSKPMIIAGILMFAAVTALLYVWGLRKSITQRADLHRILLNRCGNKIVKYLKKNGTITLKQAAEQIKGISAGEFWSKNRLAVQNPKVFVPEVLAFLTDQQYIEFDTTEKLYRLKK